MSLPAYMFLYDENGNPIKGGSNVAGREGAIEILNSNYHINQVCCSNTGKLMGARDFRMILSVSLKMHTNF